MSNITDQEIEKLAEQEIQKYYRDLEAKDLEPLKYDEYEQELIKIYFEKGFKAALEYKATL